MDILSSGVSGLQDIAGTLSSTADTAVTAKAESTFRDFLSTAANQNDPAKIKNAAKQFEALMLGQILKASRQSGENSWLGDDEDQAGATAVDLAEEQFAQAMAAGGGLGISKLVEKVLTNQAKTANSGQTQPQPAKAPDMTESLPR